MPAKSMPSPTHTPARSHTVVCILGVPIAVMSPAALCDLVADAAEAGRPTLVSTVNANFLARARANADLQASLLRSEVCVADGAPVVWIARLLGVRAERVAGSDLLEGLRRRAGARRALGVFFFGGEPGVAEAACANVTARGGGLTCAGWFDPGFGTAEELSSAAIIGRINHSGADLLAVALGVEKGQAWLLANHDRLSVPVRSHLGASLAFEAGRVRRAPGPWQRLGLEWLWRIREEPRLWRRYVGDGAVLAWLLATRVLPLALWLRRHARTARAVPLAVTERPVEGGTVGLSLAGFAAAAQVCDIFTAWRDAGGAGRTVVLDLARLRGGDTAFFGALLRLHALAAGSGGSLRLEGAAPPLARLFRWNCVEWMLDERQGRI
jgi:N-acetylglucosaminyldiphosphoundecaprenol N-acetyl-beta-D-mannosaminyltransferase